MEDRDPSIVLQACIAFVRRGELGEAVSGEDLERSLLRVGDALRDRDREIEWLREALEQSREDERSRAQQLMPCEQSSTSYYSSVGDLPGGFEGGALNERIAEGGDVVLSAHHGTEELELDHDRTTKPVNENTTVLSNGKEPVKTKPAAECVEEQGTLHSTGDGLAEGEEAGEGEEGRRRGEDTEEEVLVTRTLQGEGGGEQEEGTGEGGGEQEEGTGEGGGEQEEGTGEGQGEEIVQRDSANEIEGETKLDPQQIDSTPLATSGDGVEGGGESGEAVQGEGGCGDGVEGEGGRGDGVEGEGGRGEGLEGEGGRGDGITNEGGNGSGVEGEGGGGKGVEESGGYQRVEFPALYYHAATGYYYDAGTQQFFAPVNSGYQATAQSDPVTEQATVSTGQSSNLTGNAGRSTFESGPTGPQPRQPSSVADMLAAVSEHASHKCGLSYDETSGMYYDHRYAMYYDQETQLYYDAEGGTYYEYDPETRQYQVHSHVKLPKKPRSRPEDGVEKVVDLCSSSDSENEGSPEEGELRYPKYPEGSPPPEEEWAPCLRLVASSSECVPRGSVYVVTQEGAKLGREPDGPNPILLREVQVSKSHGEIKYSRSNRCFTLCDLASQNGTFLNNKRISEPKQQSKPHPLNHCDTLTIGTTSFTLHIHTGWDTCEYCRWEERGGGGGGGEGSQKVGWKSELNRIKKRYCLRLKDTYGEDPVRGAEGYQDRAAGRRQTVGSDMPDPCYPDAPSTSVHRALDEESVGHKMLQKLGWKKGESLGKGNKGITEPVKADVREARSGLGSAVGGGKRSLDTVGSESAAKHRRLVKHYTEVVSREQRQSQRQ